MTNTTLATIAATTRATRFWVGTNGVGDIAQFWTAEPSAEDFPTLDITAHVVMPLGSNGAPAGFEPLAASADQAAGVVPAELTDAQREQVRDAVAQALTGIYYCGRVWSAWQVGTMTEDDFTPAADIDDVLTEITDAAINAMPLAASPAVQQPAEQAAAVAESQPAAVQIMLYGNAHSIGVMAMRCLEGEFAPHTFAVHHALLPNDRLSTWDYTVTNIETGRSVGTNESIEKAIDTARSNLSVFTPEELAVRVQRFKDEDAPLVPAAPATSDKAEG